ncbi:HAMP domain-containing protein [Duganella sp. FT92W]|uniref:HAMP domain-containing protein n=1 Tax=Pseudoduganella rivuli TaxID=2666085 RepID=A0A7X2LPI1_9BURK|nr:methyl-accepting chemotaxis protein [Pseudoduganella rivuli]MRV70290.1 HAMP domain-containing protein [Pseudoduganella rivuli]
MSIANLKIGTRMASGFGLLLALLLLIALLGARGMAGIQAKLEEIAFANNAAVKLAGDMYGALDDETIALRNLALLTETADMTPEVARLDRDQKSYAEAESKLGAMFAGSAAAPEQVALFEKIKALKSQSAPFISRAIEAGLANRKEEATKLLMVDFRPIQFQWRSALKELATLENKLNDEAALDARASYAKARSETYALGALALVLGCCAAWYITRGIVRPIRQALHIAQTVASGDLSGNIQVGSKDETGQLLQALKDMNTSLVKIVADVRTGADAIATASGQIAAGNQDLSARTEQQAGSLEETASSMEEFTSTVQHNAGNAQQGNALAMAAAEVATRGGAVVAQVVDKMNAITTSANKIADIIAVIDGIAFQTNILALNAAVEAARAGQQGLGFAVVASEVRALAQRSAAAAKEIKALIDESVGQVESGSKLVDQAGETMRDVVASVERVNSIMSEISQASREQATGIEQVNRAISQMDQVTQQNAALVEEAASAAQALEEQAGRMVQAVSVFKLAAHGQGPAPATPHKAITFPAHLPRVKAALT